MRIAAVDLGSNSFHLLVADVTADGTFEPLVREKEMLRLGDVVSREGFVTADAADAAVNTMRRFRLLAEAAGATELLACATSALRSASNGDEVLDRIANEAGVEVDAIGGLEEARLIFGAIRAAITIDPAPAVCFDLGGGSLEITVGDAGGMRWAASERLGVARLSAQFVHSDPISDDNREQLRQHITTALAPLATEVAQFKPQMAIGSSGTLEDIAQMIAARRKESAPRSLNQSAFSREEFLPLHRDLVESDSSQRRDTSGLDTKRVELIVAGVELLDIAMDLFAIQELTISEWALREGIVLDAIGRHDPEDWSEDPRAIRRASVQSLARRCSWPEEHSRHVAALALQLFDQTATLHELSETDRELLEYAALLHDIGEHVSHDDHDRHAAYLVSHGQLRGLTPEEVTILTGVVRWHRRGEPKTSDNLVGDLTDSQREVVRRLAAILRLADGLDRSRKQLVTNITARIDPAMTLIRIATTGDPELELWGARRKRELFERVYERDVEFIAHPSE